MTSDKEINVTVLELEDDVEDVSIAVLELVGEINVAVLEMEDEDESEDNIMVVNMGIT